MASPSGQLIFKLMGEKSRREEDEPPKKDWSLADKILAERQKVKDDAEQHRENVFKKYPSLIEGLQKKQEKLKKRQEAFVKEHKRLQKILETRPLTREEKDNLDRLARMRPLPDEKE